MASPVAIGDIIALGTLLFKTYEKCKKASSEYQQLANMVECTQLCVESARASIEPIYLTLPDVHKRSIGKAVIGLREVAVNISDDLSKFSSIVPGTGAQYSKLKFAILQNPREAESQLSMRLSMLNVCMSAVINDSLTRSNMNYDLDKMSSLSQRQSSTHSTAKNTTPEIDLWKSAADPSGNILARGFYDYAATCGQWTSPRFKRVEITLRIQGTQLVGSSQDNVGHASLQGSFNPTDNSVSLIKQYYAPKEATSLRWEYAGYITSCGIVGEWRYPGNPPETAHWRGKFGIWLQRDEDARGREFEEQMRLLNDKGQVLTRSMSFVR